MHNLSTKIPQCSVTWRTLWKGDRQRVQAPGLSGKNNVILPLGSRGGLREICLFILKGGEIQYSSDGNWIVPDTTCLSLSLSFSLSLFHHFSPGQSVHWRQRLSFSSYICHNWFLPTAVLDTASCTQHKQTVRVSVYVQVFPKWNAGIKTKKSRPARGRGDCEISLNSTRILFWHCQVKSEFWLMTTQPPTLSWRSRWPDISLF